MSVALDLRRQGEYAPVAFPPVSFVTSPSLELEVAYLLEIILGDFAQPTSKTGKSGPPLKDVDLPNDRDWL